EMLDEQKTPVGKFYGDGIFDTWNNYHVLDVRRIALVIPPQRNAVLTRHGNSKLPKLPRDEAIRGCRKLGRKSWKVKVGYHRRSLAETAMFRMKTIFGGHLKNRLLRNQKVESRIRCKILNKFTMLGMPKYD
ncbi:MAG: IS5 family transposase, partial [Oscillospiraceae bacterium]|nr:IS5 family transposase [Oscillospiraceae bacterium]